MGTSTGGFERVIEAGQPWLTTYGLWAVFVGLFTETVMFTGVVVPGFGILVAAGFLVAAGALPLWPVVLIKSRNPLLPLVRVRIASRLLHSLDESRRLLRRKQSNAHLVTHPHNSGSHLPYPVV